MIILVLIALSIFLIGAIGLAIDSAHLYSQRQMAQVAADAAAQAAIMSVFKKTNTAAYGNVYPSITDPWTCTAAEASITPCYYAARNGFGESSDIVRVDYPPPSTYPGVNLAPGFTPNLIRVTILRDVQTSFMQFVGAASLAKIAVQGVAAIVLVEQPVPILVLHPTRAESFFINGNPLVTICGGPPRSIQVNSCSVFSAPVAECLATKTEAIEVKGLASMIDLSKAGPGVGFCNGTGGQFGVLGGPRKAYPSGINYGTNGYYDPGSGPIPDPLRNIAYPADPGGITNPPSIPLADGVGGCPPVPKKPCRLYVPGRYTEIIVTNETAVFQPGLYYIVGGDFRSGANGHVVSSVVYAPGLYPPAGDGIGEGMVVFLTAGRVDIGANGDVNLRGAPFDEPRWLGILFFGHRGAPAHAGMNSHSMGGNGELRIVGTSYFTNTLPDGTLPNPAVYQNLKLQGTPGSTTQVTGQIIVDGLELGGNAGILMELTSQVYPIPEVSLVR